MVGILQEVILTIFKSWKKKHPVNIEHWLKSNIAWPVCTKNVKIKMAQEQQLELKMKVFFFFFSSAMGRGDRENPG